MDNPFEPSCFKGRIQNKFCSLLMSTQRTVPCVTVQSVPLFLATKYVYDYP